FQQRGDPLPGKAEQVDAPVLARSHIAWNGYRVELPGDRDQRKGGHNAAHIGAVSSFAKGAATRVPLAGSCAPSHDRRASTRGYVAEIQQQSCCAIFRKLPPAPIFPASHAAQLSRLVQLE